MGSLLAGGAALGLGRLRPAWAVETWAVAAAVSGALLLAAALAGGGTAVDTVWIEPLGSRMRLELDALAAPIAVFTLWTAAAVLAWAGRYLRLKGDGPRQRERLARLFGAFAGAMLLLVLAQDLVVLFVALELTALSSFLLIEFHREDATARRAASFALVVTAGSSLAFLAGTAGIAAALDTTALAHLRPAAARGELPPWTVVCLAAGVLAKSAQVPLHVWLPRAMLAPTPVSAYLHSAALVAAGVFVLARLRELLASVPAVLDALVIVACASIAVGSVLALSSDRLKRILAYSTVAQMGYVLALVALGGEKGAAGAPLAIVAHGLCKAPLFLTAGVVTECTGADRLSRAGGALRGMPLLACTSGLAAAGLAGLPGTVGFAKDDVLLEAAGEHGPLGLAAAAVAVALTLAYAARFWGGLVRGPRDPARRPAGRWLTLPVALFALAVVAGGLASPALERVFGAAGGEVAGEPVELALAAPWELGPANVAAWSAWAAGALLYATHGRWQPGLAAVARAAGRFGPAAWADAASAGVQRASHALHRLELRDLRDRLAAVVLPTALLLGAGLVAEGAPPRDVGPLELGDAARVAALVVVCGTALLATRVRDHVALVLFISFVGFDLALFFALSGAPDVALVLVLVETALTLLFLALLGQARHSVLTRALTARRRARVPWGALAAGSTGFLLAWYALASSGASWDARRLLERAESAHGKDVVTVVLSDFRGLDTAGEVTVLAVAVLGAAAIQWGRAR